MPVGVITNSVLVLLGGLLGSGLKRFIPASLKESLPKVFGFVAISMGLMKVIVASSLVSVTMSILIGTILGEVLGIDKVLRRWATWLISKTRKSEAPKHTLASGEPVRDEALELLILAAVSFCVSGTGIFGALEEGFSGDSSVLLSKSGLDFFTAVLFASVAGLSISFLSLPQLVIMLIMFSLGGWIAPFMTPEMKNNFLSVGGAITLMNGCTMAKMSDIKAINAVPSLTLVLVFSLFIK
ncbi:MAG: DUF554 domain-containing protein [Clostridiales bacterium]|nr:DUF554 domain-containing protein [Clostridiales bacterium]